MGPYDRLALLRPHSCPLIIPPLFFLTFFCILGGKPKAKTKKPNKCPERAPPTTTDHHQSLSFFGVPAISTHVPTVLATPTRAPAPNRGRDANCPVYLGCFSCARLRPRLLRHIYLMPRSVLSSSNGMVRGQDSSDLRVLSLVVLLLGSINALDDGLTKTPPLGVNTVSWDPFKFEMCAHDRYRVSVCAFGGTTPPHSGVICIETAGAFRHTAPIDTPQVWSTPLSLARIHSHTMQSTSLSQWNSMRCDAPHRLNSANLRKYADKLVESGLKEVHGNQL